MDVDLEEEKHSENHCDEEDDEPNNYKLDIKNSSNIHKSKSQKKIDLQKEREKEMEAEKL